MKRLARNALLALLLAAPVPILAQGDGNDPIASRAQEGTNGMMGMHGVNASRMYGHAMNRHMMDDATMPMMNMMMQCAGMMEGARPNGAMRGGMGHHTGSHSMMNGGASRTEGVAHDAATAEALARAYLHGQNPQSVQRTEILGATLEAGRYIVTYRVGDTQGVVWIDAATGAVVPEDAQ